MGVLALFKKVSILTLLALVGCQQNAPIQTPPLRPVADFSGAKIDLSPDELNASTSRAIRTEYACRMATNTGLKPRFNEMDAFRIDKGNFGLIDLYGDGSLDIVAGFSDEMFKSNHWLHQSGNTERSQGYSEYMIFSPLSNFKSPEGFEFWMARNVLAGDLNGDGVDDLVAIQYGRDHKPFSPQPNIVMLSNEHKGYEKTILDEKGRHHGGALGDVDSDGDIDIVAALDDKNKVSLYLNDGRGNFTRKTIVQLNSKEHPLNVQLWDIDRDGALDLIMDGSSSRSIEAQKVGLKTRVYWGDNSGEFSSKTMLSGLDGLKMQDAEFVDLDKDGDVEVVLLSDVYSGKRWYRGYSIDIVEFSGRSPSQAKNIVNDVLDDGAADYIYKWWPYFSACDLKMDNDTDFVIEVFGQTGTTYDSKLDKIVFENDGTKFTRHELEAPMYYPKDMSKRYQIRGRAERLGVSVDRYETATTYFPIDPQIKSNYPYHINLNNIFQVWGQ